MYQKYPSLLRVIGILSDSNGKCKMRFQFCCIPNDLETEESLEY